MNCKVCKLSPSKIMPIIKITRTLTLTGVVTIEVPEGVGTDAIESAVSDEANLFELLEAKGGFSVYDMDKKPNDFTADSFEAEFVTEKNDRHLSLEQVIEAIREDEIEFEG